ncbi:unnamed protein product [Adineta steineri]|uniref:TRPM SLOG domain-containing protein n=1 Tax=Adineta steineri TaxID=433720 RepID=A0A813PM77_9BILA|nr:unnamed protein product [Adineta steineri]
MKSKLCRIFHQDFIIKHFQKGIAPWGCVSDVEQLDVYGTNVIYNKPKTNERSLESNHAHFIFIDNDTKHEYRCELEFRSHFEKSVSENSFSLQNKTNDCSYCY